MLITKYEWTFPLRPTSKICLVLVRDRVYVFQIELARTLITFCSRIISTPFVFAFRFLLLFKLGYLHLFFSLLQNMQL